VKQCAVKVAGLQRVQLPPANWFAPLYAPLKRQGTASRRRREFSSHLIAAIDNRGTLA
jgi:hypothetical protein